MRPPTRQQCAPRRDNRIYPNYQVALLVDGEQAAGSYSQIWNAAASPSGIYFCELRTASSREMRRMLLVK